MRLEMCEFVMAMNVIGMTTVNELPDHISTIGPNQV